MMLGIIPLMISMSGKIRIVNVVLKVTMNVQITPADPKELSLAEMASKLEPLGEVKLTPFILIFTSDNMEISLFKDGRAIIKGTNDQKVARSIYARYIGT
jgi:adenylyltransferase/sulfurtransferase